MPGWSPPRGENWNALVNRTIADGMPGLENLALIPGTAGAAPIQNIGATGWNCASASKACAPMIATPAHSSGWTCGRAVSATATACSSAPRGRYIITAVTLCLPKAWQPVLSYGELARELDGRAAPDAATIRDAVVAIRSRKLPDPAQVGNAGSFFKNPLVSAAQRDALLLAHPDLVSYAQPDGSYKLAAGWLIDRCGFKGVSDGPVGVYGKQALVLVHHGGGTGAMLLALANRIADTVEARFGVRIEPEPVVL